METNEEIISRLKFIGKIERNEKIDSKYVMRQPNTLSTNLYRWLISPDNRSNSLKFIKNVVERTFDIIETCIRKNDMSTCKSILLDLNLAKQGILNLRFTYNSDTKFCCDMDVIIEHIDSKIASIRETNTDLDFKMDLKSITLLKNDDDSKL